ncbi:MAG: hypothetical protein O7D29_06545 [Gemmatimonadetes bacterium]|nr:hypothetical protein [Gemmatimonadota bacterium]
MNILYRVYVYTASSMEKGVIEENTKTIHLWGNGACLMVTKEARALGWKIGQKVRVSAMKDEKGATKIVIERYL